MELYPGFSLYRGLYEFSQNAYQGNLNGKDGMKWKYFSDNAIDEVFYIIIVEWFVALIATYYIDKMSSSGKDLLFFLKNQNPFKISHSLQKQVSAISVEMEKLDVIHEVLQKNYHILFHVLCVFFSSAVLNYISTFFF